MRLRSLVAPGLALCTLALAACGSDSGRSAAPTAPAGLNEAGASFDRGRVGADLRPIVTRPVTGSLRYPGLTIRFRGKFDGKLDGEDTNLPESNYPYPDLLGGRFEGTVTLAPGTEPLPRTLGGPDPADNYKFGRVTVDILSASGTLVHRIVVAPDNLQKFDDHRRLRLNLGSATPLPGVAEDLVIDLEGIFMARDGMPPTAGEINQAALGTGALTIYGPHPGTQWNLDVSLLEMAAVEGADN